MAVNLAHFALNADDIPTSRAFYEKVFGWSFVPWGPPGFYHIRTGAEDAPVQGALQQRRELIAGRRTIAPECTFTVEDVEATARAVVAAGGRILMDRFTISGVGHLIFFEDPAGNAIGAMQSDADAE
ncbi:MAG: VOC family protein [Micropruina sp.]|uniref:VOC family protein n=1 Tax=Micropruina sp. TaxID=2737536 RepID=UPI0039E675E1